MQPAPFRAHLAPMKPSELWAELKRRRVVRVVLAYAVTVFVVLQVADLTLEPLGLPAWSYRFLLFLSLAGFPVAVALAWAFDVTPEGVRSESERKDGRGVGRWVVGGATVLALGIGIWQVGGDPDPLGAEGIDPELMAVVPFRVSSSDERVTILREGVLDLLSPIFSGAPRTVDSGAMINAWEEYGGGYETDLSEGQAVELARRLGAGRVLVGSVVGTGDAFSVNARLLSVPGGELLGTATVDGSATRLRETISEMAAQILSLEAGLEEAQVDYLSAVPLEALEAYLEGRRLYRRNRYVAARTAFSRALDVDSTFALAALGAYESVTMGIDADRDGLLARAVRLLRAHMDALPSRDRVYARLWLGDGGRRSASELVRESGASMVSELPEKPEAWYVYADQLFHHQWMVGEDDWRSRAVDAFQRALELDPGLSVAEEHLFYDEIFSLDSVDVRRTSEDFLAAVGPTGSGLMALAVLAYGFDDPEWLQWIDRELGNLPFAEVQLLALTAMSPYAQLDRSTADRMFDRVERSAIAESDRRQAVDQRYRYYRVQGRTEDAERTLRRYEDAHGPRPRAWIRDHLYWQGSAEPAGAAADELSRRVATGPLPWTDGGFDACVLELYRIRRGSFEGVEETVRRLRAASDDPDPRHGRNALCALALETIVAHEEGEPSADDLVARLTDVLDDGPANSPELPEVPLELARILDERGRTEDAARVAGYMYLGTPFALAESTRHLASARLWDKAGNLEKAAERYRWFLTFRRDPDPALVPEAEAVRERLAEIEGTERAG